MKKEQNEWIVGENRNGFNNNRMHAKIQWHDACNAPWFDATCERYKHGKVATCGRLMKMNEHMTDVNDHSPDQDLVEQIRKN